MFAIGDNVKVTDARSEYYGWTGLIVKIDAKYIKVRWSDIADDYQCFPREFLTLYKDAT